MELRLTNGATVTRVHGKKVAELLAGFQYESDAIAFAKTKLVEDAGRQWFDSWYVVTNHYNGHVEIVAHPEKEAA